MSESKPEFVDGGPQLWRADVDAFLWVVERTEDGDILLETTRET